MKYQCSPVPKAVAMFSALMAVIAVDASAASLSGIGHLPDGQQSDALAVSRNGVYVGGSAQSGQGTVAIRWSAKTRKLQNLGTLPGSSSTIIAISDNGGAMVGKANDEEQGTIQAVRWTKQKGRLTGLGYLPGNSSFSRAQGVSKDGSVVFGFGITSGLFHAFRWTKSGGMVDLNERFGIDQQFLLYSTSADGKVASGMTYMPDDSSMAVRWSKQEGLTVLGTVAGGSASSAPSVSGDGKVAVGSCSANGKLQACRWVETGPAQGVGFISGYDNSYLLATSGDGAVAVGQAFSFDASAGKVARVAIIWSEAHGLWKLQDVLETDYGLDTAGWKLEVATGISSDGKTIVGTGKNPEGEPEGWVVSLK